MFLEGWDDRCGLFCPRIQPRFLHARQAPTNCTPSLAPCYFSCCYHRRFLTAAGFRSDQGSAAGMVSSSRQGLVALFVPISAEVEWALSSSRHAIPDPPVGHGYCLKVSQPLQTVPLPRANCWNICTCGGILYPGRDIGFHSVAECVPLCQT